MNVQFFELDGIPLSEILKIKKPLLDQDKAHFQLEYLAKYVREAELGAKSAAVEEHYIDRDFIEDYSAFYSRNLEPVVNHCRRVHFFTLDAAEAKRKLAALRRIGDRKRFHEAASKFSRQHYLGFCVVKPLWGSPVGRTVLRQYSGTKREDGCRRDFGGTSSVPVHLTGVPLHVQGLAFQQQDLGVSACATTALWSALHRMRDLEGGAPATPATITMRASQYALPFGRSMPSEGLDLNQMCQAVQAFGYSPALSRIDDYFLARWILFSANQSGMSPVVVLERADRRRNEVEYHAVSVAGIKKTAVDSTPEKDAIIHDASVDLLALYIHDDRYGPYLLAPVTKLDNGMELEIELSGRPEQEKWRVSHILIPMHNKVRLSFSQLSGISHGLAVRVRAAYEAIGATPPCVAHRMWIERSSNYLEKLILARTPPTARERLCCEIPLSRYVGAIRLRLSDSESVDVLLDTTSTARNLVCSAVVALGPMSPNSVEAVEFFATQLRCPCLL
jgi:hypothetical protein